MCPIDRDIATPTRGWDELGSSYATATRSPSDVTLTLEGFLPNTIGTGEWNVAALSIEWAKNIPGPFFGSEKYAMWTYPLAESAAIAGAGLPHPLTPWSVESAITGSAHFSPALEREVMSVTLESRCDSHHTAYLSVPAFAILSDPGQAALGGTASRTLGNSFGVLGAPEKTMSPHSTFGELHAERPRVARKAMHRIRRNLRAGWSDHRRCSLQGCSSIFERRPVTPKEANK